MKVAPGGSKSPIFARKSNSEEKCERPVSDAQVNRFSCSHRSVPLFQPTIRRLIINHETTEPLA